MDRLLARGMVKLRVVRLLQVETATQRHRVLGVQRRQEVTDRVTIRHRLRFADPQQQQVGWTSQLRTRAVLLGLRKQLRTVRQIRRMHHGVRGLRRVHQLGAQILRLEMDLGIRAVSLAWTLSLGSAIALATNTDDGDGILTALGQTLRD